MNELTRRTQKRIITGRPFSSLGDFLTRVDPRPKEAEHLIRVGAFDGLGQIPDLLTSIQHGGWQGGQMPLFSLAGDSVHESQDWSLEQKAAAQVEILGISVIAHPLELHQEKIDAAGAMTTLSAAKRIGQRVRVAGLQFTRQQRRSKKGENIYLLDLEDLEGMLLVVVPENIYHRHRSVFSREHPFIVEGEISLQGRFNEPAIQAERAWRL